MPRLRREPRALAETSSRPSRPAPRRSACCAAPTAGPPSPTHPLPPAAHDTGAYATHRPRLRRTAGPVLDRFDRRRLRLLGAPALGDPLLGPPGPPPLGAPGPRPLGPPGPPPLGAPGPRPPGAPGPRLLDAGAGRGRFVAAARNAGFQADGIEPSARGVRAAAASSTPYEIRAEEIATATVAPGRLDAVTLWHVLEHLDDPRRRARHRRRLAATRRPDPDRGAEPGEPPGPDRRRALVPPRRPPPPDAFHDPRPRAPPHRLRVRRSWHTTPSCRAQPVRHVAVDRQPAGPDARPTSTTCSSETPPSRPAISRSRSPPSRSSRSPPASSSRAGLAGHGGTVAVLARRPPCDQPDAPARGPARGPVRRLARRAPQPPGVVKITPENRTRPGARAGRARIG